MLNNISHRLPPSRGVVNFIWAQLYTVVNNTPPAEWEQRLAREQEFADNPQVMQTLKKIREKWMNAKNDALGLCAHASWRGDIFVTNDNHFLKAKEKLSHLIPGKILRPKDAVQEVDRVAGRQ